MHAHFIFILSTIVVLFFSPTVSSTSHPSLTHRKHHLPKQNRPGAPINTHTAESTRRTRVKHVLSQRSLMPLLNALTSDHEGILSASRAFAHTAKSARSSSADDDAYRQETLAGLVTYRHSLDPLRDLFSQLAANKGLANYDGTNKYETLLKDIINASKCTLSEVDSIINADPQLGPILGPIVYEIKCILDEILDATENLTDAALNWLAPLLKPLILGATKTVCSSILPPVAGLCLPV